MSSPKPAESAPASGVDPHADAAPAPSAITACTLENVRSLVEALERAAVHGAHQLEVRTVRDGPEVHRVVVLDGDVIAPLPDPEHIDEFLQALDKAAEGRPWAHVIPRMLEID